MTIFIIDPGHSGNDLGTIGNNLQEKYLTLDMQKE